MKKNSLTGRTICTRSVTASTSSPASVEPGLRRSNREKPSKKPITPASSTRKSERLASSPASQRSDKGRNVLSQNTKGSDKSGRNADTSLESNQRKVKRKTNIEESTNKIKKREPIMSDKGKNVLSQNTKGSDKSGRNADTSLESNQRKVKRKTNIEESTNKIKKREPLMSARSYRALFRGKLNLPKRVRYFPESDEIDNVGNRKKRKKASDDVTDHPVTDSQVDNDERKASGKDHNGALESSKVAVALPSLCRSATATNGTLIENDAFGLYYTASHISGIPEDMLGRQIPCESQRSLHAVLKSEMAKLGKVLDFSENWTSMVEKFLEYVIENHRVCEEPATTLQAFQIALSWIAASLVNHKFKLEDSLVHAKTELAFNCSRGEVEYIYSMLYCMKSLFLESAQGLQLDCFGTNSNQSMVITKQVNESISEAEECLTEKRGSHYSTATKDIKKTISDIKEKYKKKEQKLVQAHEGKKVELVNRFADKKRELETRKKLKAELIHTSTQSLGDDLKRLDRDYERESDEITRENDECLKSLDQMHKAAKKKLAEDEACWISRIEKWAQVEFKKCVPIKSANNKHCSGICSPSTSKSADVQTCNDVNGEATCADMNCMLSKGNQVGEAENTLGTMRGGSYEMVASAEEKVMDISCLSREQPADNVATKSQSSEYAPITVPEIVFPASCQEEFTALNVHLSEHQTSDTMTSAGPDEDVSSKLSEISQSFANLTKCASPASSLNREEILVTIENDTTSHVDSDADKILDQQNEEACSLDKEIRDELVVETRGSAEFGQDDPHICPMPSSPAEKQPDPASNTQGENIEAAIEPQTTGSETVETGDFVTLEQGGQVTCPLPSSPPGNQPDPAAIILGQNIETPAEPRIVGPDAGEISDSAVSDQETMGPQDACSLPPASVGTQSDLAANVEGQNTRTVAQLHTAGSNAVVDQGAQNASPLPFSSPRNDPDAAGNIEGLINTTVTEPHTTGSDASPLPFSSPENHPDAAVNTKGVNNPTMTEPHTSGSDACEMEIADTGPHVEQSTFADNLVDEGGVEPSAGVTTHVLSLLNNGTVQSTVQPIPQIPFPVFNDPFQYELEKFRRETENTQKTYEEKKSILKAELGRKMAEVQAEYQRKFNEVEAEHKAIAMENNKNKSFVIMNKVLANTFLSKCTTDLSHPSAISRGRIQQLAQRAAQVSALRNNTARARARAPLQPQASSFPCPVPRPSSLSLHSALCPMPQPRQPLIFNSVPSPSASLATNPVVNARLGSPVPHLNTYRSSTAVPTATASPTALQLPRALVHSLVLVQQQQQEQQQNLGRRLQGSNDVV